MDNAVILHFIFICVAGHLFSKVDQNPAEIIVSSGESCTLSCSHSISSYNTILWYYQRGQNMHIIGYSFHSTVNLENAADKRYDLNGDAKSSVNLTISKLMLNESTVYFCAASAQCCSPPISPTKSLLSFVHLSLTFQALELVSMSGT